MASYDSIVAPLAADAAAQLGDSTAEILGQWNAETGYGSEPDSGRDKNNPGNVEVDGAVASFPTMAQGVAAYIQTEQHYGTNDADSPSAFAEANAGYDPTNPNYPNLLLGTIEGPQTQSAAQLANTNTASDSALLASIPVLVKSDAAKLKAAKKANIAGADPWSDPFSLNLPKWLDLSPSKWFEENWEYMVIILAIVLLIGAGIFGLSKSVTDNGFLPIPE